MAKSGVLIILSAPSGAGKTTVVDRLLIRHPDWKRSISATTRPLREGEKEGVDYYFKTRDEFEGIKAKGEFLEFATVHSHSYGTPKAAVIESIERGENVILAIDVQGMVQVKENLAGQYPTVSLFLLPPSIKILRERLEGRKTDSIEEIDRRLRAADEEIKMAHLYDHTIINQQLDAAVIEADNRIQDYQESRR